ncbi:MAG: hypothetical protein BroJett039_10190 [Chloroflexota bacterium]|nr:MAG: hypothetical protein BroJett039_10190 [Chloroflexota bacterium]
MAIAKSNVGVTRGYKPKRARAAQRGPNVWRRVTMGLRQNAHEMIEFARDEIAGAALDTMQLWEYLRYISRRATRTRVAPVIHELETLAHGHEMTNDLTAFAVEQAGALNVGTFKRRAL